MHQNSHLFSICNKYYIQFYTPGEYFTFLVKIEAISSILKMTTMKKNNIIAAVIFIITITCTACEALNTCKICRQVRYEDGRLIYEGPEREYCNTDLVAIETASDVIIGNIRETWECR